MLRNVAQVTPGTADDEGEGETEAVEQRPVAVAGDTEHGEVEYGVPGKQHDVAAFAGGYQKRRGKSGDQREHGENERVLGDGQYGRGRDQQCQQDKRRGRRQHLVEPQRGEDGQRQHTNCAALQRYGEHASTIALSPGKHQGGDGRSGNAGQAQFDGGAQPALLGGVAQERGHADEQHDQSDLDRYVALGEPVREAASRSGRRLSSRSGSRFGACIGCAPNGFGGLRTGGGFGGCRGCRLSGRAASFVELVGCFRDLLALMAALMGLESAHPSFEHQQARPQRADGRAQGHPEHSYIAEKPAHQRRVDDHCAEQQPADGKDQLSARRVRSDGYLGPRGATA